jgi:Luciferase-like monooxygenase
MRLLTIGVSSLPGEAAAVGVDYATRVRRADEAIDVLRTLWAGDATGTSFDGEFYSERAGPVEVGEVHLMDPKAPGDTIGYVLAQRANDQCGAVASGDERVLGAVPE